MLSLSQIVWADDQINLKAIRVQQAPNLDGKPDDECWKNATPVKLNYQNEPRPGNLPTENTEVKMVYDNNAIYFLAICYDKHLDSIQHKLTQRGTVWGNTENFYIFLDTYHDGVNAYGFGVSVDNVQDDFKASQNGEELDDDWDAVWESKTSILENAWCVEIKIPYSAIRFPKKEIQDWSCDLVREIRRKKEITSFTTTAPTIQDFIPYFNPIKGVEKIESPLRLSLSPYLSEYYFLQGNHTGQAFRGGADVKYGINESFTLDMTLIPDFGQVVSDQVVKNLTPYEVQYQERRPFFLEGAELFSKNDLFYSRRIGDLSSYNTYRKSDTAFSATNPPTQTQLINAFKITGKTKENLSIGLFNAVTNNLYADANDINNNSKKILYEPLTNYNIFVVEKTLKNNSHLGFINTNVIRTAQGNDANVTGVDAKILDKKSKYAFAFQENISNIFLKNGTDFSQAKSITGNRTVTSFGKIAGMWQWGYNLDATSSSFNSNDLGYLAKNNYIHHNLYLHQFITKPFWKILNMNNLLALDQENLFDGQKYAYTQISERTKLDWKNYLTMVTYFWVKPFVSKDFYEPRVDGWFYNIPKVYQSGIYFSSDYRKTLAIDAGTNFRWLDEKNRNKIDYEITPRLKLGKKFLLIYGYTYALASNQRGWVQNDGDQINFGKRNVIEISNSLNFSYVFTNRISLSVIARHYWSGGRYSQYYLLQKDGSMQNIADNLNADFDFNAWTLDAVFTMQFAPGSFLTLAWKNLVEEDGIVPKFTYISNINNTINQPLANSFSLKAIYYLDVNKLRKK